MTSSLALRDLDSAQGQVGLVVTGFRFEAERRELLLQRHHDLGECSAGILDACVDYSGSVRCSVARPFRRISAQMGHGHLQTVSNHLTHLGDLGVVDVAQEF